MSQSYLLVAPNGARRGKTDHPALPETTEEIVNTAAACQKAGADGLHLHIRDDVGTHSLDAGRYRETLDEIGQTTPELDIQITTEAAGLFNVAAQLHCLEKVRPSWVSISVREIARSPELADRVYGICLEHGTRVQHILYDAADMALLDQWQTSGIVRQDQVDRLFVLGRYASGMQSSPQDLKPFLASNPPSTPWMVCAFGASEHNCLRAAALKGGDIRVGFENSFTNQEGVAWLDNGESISALVQSLERTPE